MSTPTVAEQVRWQDLKVRSEVDIVLEIAKKEGWEDCEVFGSGAMITQPQESMGWTLIPADLYKYSIPIEAVARLYQIINAGVRVQGVIIADDQRRPEPAPTPASAQPRVSRPSVKPIVSIIGKALLGFIRSVGAGLSWIGKAILRLIRVVCIIAIVSFLVVSLIPFFWPVILVGGLVAMVAGAASGLSFDPKLVILVDDGTGGTTWVSLFTWYD